MKLVIYIILIALGLGWSVTRIIGWFGREESTTIRDSVAIPRATQSVAVDESKQDDREHLASPWYETRPRVTGVIRFRGQLRVHLDDGTWIDAADGVERVESGGVIVDGRKYAFVPMYGGIPEQPEQPEQLLQSLDSEAGHRHTAHEPTLYDTGPRPTEALDRKMSRNNVLR